MPFITVNEVKTFYFENKIVGTPILFIHGWLGSSLEWIYQLCYFNSKKHIIMVDLPGFGKSDKPKIKYSIDFFTKQIIDFLKIFGYNEIILVGHSLGGMIAQNITIKKPSLVKKLILISTGITFSQSIKDKFILFWINMIFKLFYKKFLINIIKQILSTKATNREVIKLYNNVLKIPKRIVLRTFKNMTSKFNIDNQLSKISQPTLIIYGDQDKVISNSMINDLSNLIPKSEIITIENCPHRVMVEEHEQVNKAIDNFIKK